ncbi:alcohol dehydrogenase catalytic domain-containing protein [Micromonospora sp. D75]|uniref:alcohol dehydrogenase catalytic domain-containing protein n=1 Tax=Micromonospora sp. D75 TaxID=2824885 RepID=UPI00249421A7|nr:zinc-dependent alcohol dehydrogenase [Micromonospora sp. D75]
MRASVVTAFDRPMEITERPVPEVGPGEILVRVEASGLCHTDIHAARGEWPVKPTPPFVPGHEGVGLVEQVGPGVTEHAVGDRVALPWLGWACGTCAYCVTGWETLCESQRNTGYSIDGAHAEYAVASARYAVRVPDGVDPFEAAPLTCAGVTTYKAVKVAGVRPGERVAIFGIGGLGHLAQQYAQIFGAETVAVDVTAEKLELATSLGAAHTVDAATTDPVERITALGGVDVAIVLAASPRVIEQAHRSLRRGGGPAGQLREAGGVPGVDLGQAPVAGRAHPGGHCSGGFAGTRQPLPARGQFRLGGGEPGTGGAQRLGEHPPDPRHQLRADVSHGTSPVRRCPSAGPGRAGRAAPRLAHRR